MGKQVRLIHCLHGSRVAQALKDGLKAVSAYDDLNLDMRRGVIYCWLRREDDKMSQGGQRPEHAYLEVTVDEESCLVADMEWSSLAMMYQHGSRRPQHPEASRLLAELYRVTAVPLSEYAPGMFFTPEVLVKGDIRAEHIRLADRLDVPEPTASRGEG